MEIFCWQYFSRNTVEYLTEMSCNCVSNTVTKQPSTKGSDDGKDLFNVYNVNSVFKDIAALTSKFS